METKLNVLLQKLEILEFRQKTIGNEIQNLKSELDKLKTLSANIKTAPVPDQQTLLPREEKVIPTPEPVIKPEEKTLTGTVSRAIEKNGVEKFIGENLINKVGIAVLVIGISIGVKYAIDHDLISPVVRILLGYMAGGILLFFSWRVRKNFPGYSAVLLSGAMAAMYFITYAAFTYYSLYPRWLTFALMVILTAFTVMAAVKYNRQVIAHFGLIGAYAIPFLLNDPDAAITTRFSYMVIINAGILYISYRKYWKLLNYSAFIVSWIIFLNWYTTAYDPETDFAKGLLFSTLFYALFYAILLLYKLEKIEKFLIEDIVFLLVNSFIFFGTGYSIINKVDITPGYTGLFTLINAMVHGGIALFISSRKPADRNIFYFVAGLSLTFLTITIPVQLNGSWVTLLWAGEAVILFWIGRTQKEQVWEFLSYLLLIMAFYSLLHDWMILFPKHLKTGLIPLFNTDLLASLFFIAFLIAVYRIDLQNKAEFKVPYDELYRIFSFALSGIILFVIYVTFFREVNIYWVNQIRQFDYHFKSGTESNPLPYFLRNDLYNFKSTGLINYSLLFVTLLSVLNSLKFKYKNLALVSLLSGLVFLLFFLTAGLDNFSDLRRSYLNNLHSGYNSEVKIFLRYFSYLLAGSVLYISRRSVLQFYNDARPKVISEVALYIIIWWIASSELINILELSAVQGSNKLGLSILWGVYSLVLIVQGILKNKKHLRIFAFVLFGITLIKLFFYDLSYLDTISKTVVFVILGTLLLVISFLYNKFKHLIL